ncbi:MULTISPECIES: SWIM zinc finger family protein [unclassified Variovorax]|uniref:SWIM zinc finger family protein n=1 Tax=unclassified Variovorax TaxID=663243 RepID=UPI000F7D89AE|nr:MULTISPECIES: SWIM zinc finger family protein [unclassified Variovorax]RSZ29963.1 SWIM zinc finger family protein [Variovorax sp. 553]RSZ30484.1 SWIM zinc finger family protein [Variovorax sp. 679]
MSAVAHAYRYAHASAALAEPSGPRLSLATSSPQTDGGTAHPHFFEGQLLQPRLCAELLSAVHLVVGSRFFTPANSVARAIALADPVVTAGGELLRFEGFSSCCSCYVRVDLLPDSYDGQVMGKGTTNVDFNAPMRAALARMRDADGLALSVGRDALTLQSGDSEVVERKVALPLRWLRGMVEVQSYLASMRQRFELKGLEALRFLRTLPRASTSRTPLWVVPSPKGPFTTTKPHPQGVRVTDASRLRVLEALLPKARSLAVHADEAQQASAWVLDFPGARLTLALSAEPWRGFSGEGQALRALMRMDDERAVSQVRAQLNWQALIDAPALGRTLDIAEASVEDSLRILGASGLVGFDLVERRYFHRVLPFDLSSVEDMHPRLADARELMARGAVTIANASPVEAQVSSSGTSYSVREIDGELRCTCPWYAKHQGERGPCKHVLAVEATAFAAEGGQ